MLVEATDMQPTKDPFMNLFGMEGGKPLNEKCRKCLGIILVKKYSRKGQYHKGTNPSHYFLSSLPCLWLLAPGLSALIKYIKLLTFLEL